MAEILVFENVDGQQINEIYFSRTIKNVPSRSTQIFIRNQSTERPFVGSIGVLPGMGRSYSEDLFVSERGESWDKRVDMSIAPNERFEFRLRSTPLITPANNVGQASLGITGKWI